MNDSTVMFVDPWRAEAAALALMRARIGFTFRFSPGQGAGPGAVPCAYRFDIDEQDARRNWAELLWVISDHAVADLRTSPARKPTDTVPP